MSESYGTYGWPSEKAAEITEVKFLINLDVSKLWFMSLAKPTPAFEKALQKNILLTLKSQTNRHCFFFFLQNNDPSYNPGPIYFANTPFAYHEYRDPLNAYKEKIRKSELEKGIVDFSAEFISQERKLKGEEALPPLSGDQVKNQLATYPPAYFLFCYIKRPVEIKEAYIPDWEEAIPFNTYNSLKDIKALYEDVDVEYAGFVETL
jgi:hypothetical protein